MSGLRQDQVDTLCTVDGCDRPLMCRGVCNAHYREQRRRGTFARKRGPVCSVEGCERPHKGRGLCNMHYQRHRSGSGVGSAERRIAPAGTSWFSRGYEVVRNAGHPLASTTGHVYVHRMRMFDLIGPGEHACWGCGRTVRWDLTYPVDELALVVDHIDRDSANNDVSNLRPSCQSCNAKRSKR
jgi:hypothetical protein